MKRPALVAEELCHIYKGEIEALAGISFRAEPGEFLCLIGPSGCGKSTLLRILGGLLIPTKGQVRLDGQILTGPTRRIGFVFQKANLMPWRTVLRNVTLPLEVQDADPAAAQKLAREMLSLVGLEGFESAYPHHLSGGMQQRVALARALIQEPLVLLLDEPFGALDALTREHLNLELLRLWEAKRQTVIMVTHDIQEAVFLADRVLVMSKRPGRLAAEVPISLPRPRDLSILYSPAFGMLFQKVRAALG